MAEQQEKELGDRLRCYRIDPARPVPDVVEDARAGLLAPPRSLPPKYFYDDRGSRLFDRICDTPEYYPTRVESALLRRHAGDILSCARPSHLLELGSGTSRKTRHLLAAAESLRLGLDYWPFDVSESTMVQAAEGLLADFPWLNVNILVGDYNGGLDNLPTPEGAVLYAFLGGTLGNFEPEHARAFLRELRGRMRHADRLLLGVDRIKNPAVLRAAYNDAAGVTAEFNRNVLHVLNRELDADFEVAAFRHLAEYVPGASQVEMYLIPDSPQTVHLGRLGRTIEMAAGERLRTEISRKFSPEGLEALLAEAGMTVERHYEPEDGWFSLVLARPA